MRQLFLMVSLSGALIAANGCPHHEGHVVTSPVERPMSPTVAPPHDETRPPALDEHTGTSFERVPGSLHADLGAPANPPLELGGDSTRTSGRPVVQNTQ